MNTQIILLLALIMSICELIGQSCLKYLNKNPSKYHYYFMAVLFYSIICYLLLESYKYKSMGLMNIIWSGISILIVITVGITFFGETISFSDKIGVFFVLLGLFFILYDDNTQIENMKSNIINNII